MTLIDYYHVLGLSTDATVDDIKKAYRSKARQYHPDINNAPDAGEHFIAITEAYDFLIAYHERIISDEEAYNQAIADWKKYRQTRSRRRAYVYSKSSFSTFKNSRYYKTTRIFDGTTIIYGFIISIMIIIYTIIGYFYRLKHPLPGLDRPSFFAFLMLLLLGVFFFVISLAYLKNYMAASKKGKKKTTVT